MSYRQLASGLWVDDSVPAPARSQFAVTPTSPRSQGDVTPYRTVNRDRVLDATIAGPAQRQVWQLHRAREESRDLEIRRAIWSAFVRWVRVQALGGDLCRVMFDLAADDKARLAPALERIRRDWLAFQRIPGLSGTGQTIHQLAGSVLHHKLVDGDCFLRGRRKMGRRVWDLYPGDALAEHEHQVASGSGENRRLGIVTDDWNSPIAYMFGERGRVVRQSWGIYGGGTLRVSADRVTHIRDRSGEVTAVRGWPRCTSVIEDIARLEEWYGALIRSAELRAAIGLALERDWQLGTSDPGGDLAPGEFARSVESSYTTDSSATDGRGPLRPYQEFAARGGTVIELEPGFKPFNISTGTPTQQEAQFVSMLIMRVCGALRVTPSTLFGDYTQFSFSSGQLAHQQERQGIEDEQQVLTDQFYPVIFRDFLLARWVGYIGEFPGLMPDDLKLLGAARRFVLRKYQVIDKGRLIGPILKSFEAGVLTYDEVRAELGYAGANADEVIEQWKADRRALGLPESPTTGGGVMVDGPGGDGTGDADGESRGGDSAGDAGGNKEDD